MANPSNVEQGRSVVTRWRMLAERRLSYLVELYETGRWKAYYKEPEFLKVIQEARAALKTWERLAPPDLVQDKPVEVAIAQKANAGQGNATVLASPFIGMPSAHSIESKDDLRKA